MPRPPRKTTDDDDEFLKSLNLMMPESAESIASTPSYPLPGSTYKANDGSDTDAKWTAPRHPTADRDNARLPASGQAPPPDSDAYITSTKEDFRRPGTSSVAIIGGKQTGKSYLFQSIVYRCQSGAAAGGLAPWLRGEGMRILTAKEPTDTADELNRRKFLDYYRRWTRLDQTMSSTQAWYKLRLGLKNGLFGTNNLPLDIDFFDASGEQLEAPLSDMNRKAFAHFATANVVVLCLPMWAAFPRWVTPPSKAESDNWDGLLTGFEQVVTNLREVMGSRPRPLRTVLALTMADDRRVALRSVQQKWIEAVVNDPEPHLQRLRTRGGVTRYLDNARRVSEVVLEEMIASPYDELKGMASRLNFGAGDPWVVPMSAVDGATLNQVEINFPRPEDRSASLRPPVPAHVELPLLLSLSDRFNALM